MTGIAIAGTIVSGKDIVANILAQEYGFRRCGFGNVVRERATELGIEHSRRNLQILGDSERRQYGLYVWVDKVYGLIEKIPDWTVNGLRYEEDLTGLRERVGEDFPLIWVDAPIEKRYAWSQDKKRGERFEGMTFEEFVERDKLDMGDVEDAFQNTKSLKKHASYRFWNEWGEEQFIESIRKVLGRHIGLTKLNS